MKTQEQIDDLVISYCDEDVLRTQDLKELLPEVDVEELLRKEVALRLAYVTVVGLNNTWYKMYGGDTVYVQTLKDQLLSLKVKEVA